ncbi:poly(R)-hydroxyalkanoic acid synthase subunit PhaE [Halomarina oriensis]|uniref:Poly(3-hydroxyalkanoate) polymerase subunit PhaE n=1 Tax=Halomarina oriensis TaxID=671145 RepID=A0A6B0GIS0_9EURY|nr:poly(R)-hydroxyalkanoic acid synthase subunit PhaE [Halomarina oriensis]MWG34776.1 poly(R)-hydroxyalkanoic acid synthase subunit [Halomarina oriensis]
MSEDTQYNWLNMAERMNEAMARSVEQNMEAQAKFMDSWAEGVESTMLDEETMTESVESYGRAYEVWMDAADQMYERVTDAAEGEDVSFTEFRDIWLRSANDAFKEVMSTSAFAASQGSMVEAMMDLQRETNEVSEETLSQLGFSTRGDVDEIAGRLVELERRQQDVEDKLDRILDHLEDE